MMQGSKYIAAAGVAGAALVLLRRAMRSNLVTGRNRLKLLTPIPEDIAISQAVKLTPVHAYVETKAFMAGQRGPSGWRKLAPPCSRLRALAGACKQGGLTMLVGCGADTCGCAKPLGRANPDTARDQVRELFYNAFGLTDEHLFSHGLFKGKLSLGLFDALQHKANGHYVVVVGINPTPLGEGLR